MDGLLILASLTAFLTTVIHIFAGGNDVAKPLLKAPLDNEEKYVLYACWHFSAFFVVSAIVFLLAGLGYLPSDSSLVMVLSLLWRSFGVIFFGISLNTNTLKGIFCLPQWILPRQPCLTG